MSVRPAPVPERPAERVDHSVLAYPKPTRAGRAPVKPKRTTKIKARNEERAAAKHAVMFGPQAEACRALPCVSCGKAPTPDCHSDPHHEPANSDDSRTVPLCRVCHTRRHTVGELTFWTDLMLDPADVQAAVREWISAGCPRASLPWGVR